MHVVLPQVMEHAGKINVYLKKKIHHTHTILTPHHTPHTHSVDPRCQQYVSSMSAACQQYVSSMSAACQQYVQ